MDKIAFNDAVAEIYAYYDYRPPEKKRLEMVYEKVKDIPYKAVAYIVSGITDEKDTPPRNIGKAFKEYFGRWGQSSEHQQIERPIEPCDDCNGAGFLFFRVANHLTGYGYRKVAICAACENWKRFGLGYDKPGKDTPAFPKMFKSDLEKILSKDMGVK